MKFIVFIVLAIAVCSVQGNDESQKIRCWYAMEFFVIS